MRPIETTQRGNPSDNGVPAKLPPLPAVPSENSDLPPALTAPPGVDNLLATLRRRWPIIMGIGLGAALLAFMVVWFVVPGRYASSMILRVNPSVTGGEGELAGYARSQGVVLKDPRILQEVLSLSEVQELAEVQDHSGDPVGWLQSALIVDTPTGQGPEILRVSLQGEYPEDVKTLLGALQRVYLARLKTDLVDIVKNKEAPLLQDQIDIDTQIQARRKEIVNLQAKLGVSDNKKNDLRISTLTELAREYRRTQAQEKDRQRSLQAELDRTQGQIANPQSIEIPFLDIDNQVNSDPEIRKQQEQILIIQGEIEAIKKVANPSQWPRLLGSKEAAITAAQARMEQIRKQGRPALEAAIRNRRMGELRREEAQTTTQLNKVKVNLDDVATSIRVTEQELNQLTGVGIAPQDKDAVTQLETCKADVDRLTEKHKESASQLARIRAEKNAGVRVQVLQDPQVPRERTTDRKWKYGSAAALGSFLLAFLAVALLDFRVRRVNSTRDITQGLGLAVVGTMPLVPNRDARQLLVMDEAEANPEQLALREAIDGIRTVVLHSGRQHPLHVLLIASALNGEGKTTLASQLASSLARGGRRTLLVDCDLRDPSCHELFNRPVTPGVSEVLRGDLPVEDAIQTTEQANLFLLPAGNVNAKSLQALAQDVPRTLFDVLRQHFDFIVIDTSPILPVSDALQIAEHADAVLLSIMEENSQLPAIHQAQQKLAALGVRILGAVVGGTQQGVYLYGSRSRGNAKK